MPLVAWPHSPLLPKRKLQLVTRIQLSKNKHVTDFLPVSD